MKVSVAIPAIALLLGLTACSRLGTRNPMP